MGNATKVKDYIPYGLDGYLGEQLNQLEAVLEKSIWFIDKAKDVKRVNVGGGLGVPHLPEEKHLDLNIWAGILEKYFGDRDIHVEVEPGDYIAKDAGILILSKTYLEAKKDLMFMGVDAGFNIAPEPAYYNMPFQPVPLKWNNEPLKPINVVGNINEALDVWYENAMLPDMNNEEHVIIINAGAYSSSMASNHCMRGQFKEFIIL